MTRVESIENRLYCFISNNSVSLFLMTAFRFMFTWSPFLMWEAYSRVLVIEIKLFIVCILLSTFFFCLKFILSLENYYSIRLRSIHKQIHQMAVNFYKNAFQNTRKFRFRQRQQQTETKAANVVHLLWFALNFIWIGVVQVMMNTCSLLPSCGLALWYDHRLMYWINWLE